MEDGTKEDPVQTKEPKFLSKAGWVKKAPGRLLASYKDRYIHVEKTEIVVYENEDRRTCLERLDLENYDKCLELKSPFKKKHRLILIRSPKCGNKVMDVKFQAQTAEEKDAWIKALSDGINRAKNKVFDEVKVDEGSNLEHVTRTRAKGNHNRRPPTRIHMKEVATVSSDGILRLDLDLEDALMPNGSHASVDGTVTTKQSSSVLLPTASEAVDKQSESSAEKDGQTEPKNSPHKNVIKPPIPPVKESKSSSTTEGETDRDDGQEKKVLKPPMPPSKEAKPSVSTIEEVTMEAKADKISESSSDARKKAGPPPPTPPNKPGSCSNLAEASQSTSNSHPPTPPSKEWKPFYPAVEQVQEIQDSNGGNKEREEDKEVKTIALESDEVKQSIHKKALLIVKDGGPESPTVYGHIMEEESAATVSSGIEKASDNEPQTPIETLRKSPSPLLTPEKKPNKVVQSNTQNKEDKTNITDPNAEQGPTALLQTTSDTSSSQAEEVPLTVASLNDRVTDSLSLNPVPCNSPREKKKKPEKSMDSSQHSDDNSGGSGSEDPLVASIAVLRGRHAGSDMVDVNEEDIQISVHSRPTQGAPEPQVRSKAFPCQQSKPSPALKPSTKAKSVSSEDLLSDSSFQIQVSQHTRAVAESGWAPSDDVRKLEAEVVLEMDKTSKLLSRVSQSQRCGDGEAMPEDLLAKAMEKLKAADNVLREVRKLKPAKNPSNRKSW